MQWCFSSSRELGKQPLAALTDTGSQTRRLFHSVLISAFFGTHSSRQAFSRHVFVLFPSLPLFQRVAAAAAAAAAAQQRLKIAASASSTPSAQATASSSTNKMLPPAAVAKGAGEVAPWSTIDADDGEAT